jgi:hypothetical protein
MSDNVRILVITSDRCRPFELCFKRDNGPAASLAATRCRCRCQCRCWCQWSRRRRRFRRFIVLRRQHEFGRAHEEFESRRRATSAGGNLLIKTSLLLPSSSSPSRARCPSTAIVMYFNTCLVSSHGPLIYRSLRVGVHLLLFLRPAGEPSGGAHRQCDAAVSVPAAGRPTINHSRFRGDR